MSRFAALGPEVPQHDHDTILCDFPPSLHHVQGVVRFAFCPNQKASLPQPRKSLNMFMSRAVRRSAICETCPERSMCLFQRRQISSPQARKSLIMFTMPVVRFCLRPSVSYDLALSCAKRAIRFSASGPEVPYHVYDISCRVLLLRC